MVGVTEQSASDPATPAPSATAPVPAPTGVPSVTARVVAFVAILVAGAAGAFIGWSFSDLQCEGDCTGPNSISAFVGAVLAAGGVGVVTVLGLRAMNEWRTVQARGGPPNRTPNKRPDPRANRTPPRVR